MKLFFNLLKPLKSYSFLVITDQAFQGQLVYTKVDSDTLHGANDCLIK